MRFILIFEKGGRMDMKLGVFPIILMAGLFLIIGLLLAPKYISNDMATKNELFVNGYADSELSPDNAIISLNIIQTSKTSAIALESSNMVYNKLQEYFDTFSDYNDISLETVSLNVSPKMHYDKETEEYITTGYTATHSLKMKVDDFNSKGSFVLDFIQGATELGVTVPGISFEISDSLAEATKKSLIANAMEDAWDKAKAVGDSGFIVLNTTPKNISLNYSNYSPYYKDYAMVYEEALSSSRITPEDITLSVSVNVTYTY